MKSFLKASVGFVFTLLMLICFSAFAFADNELTLSVNDNDDITTVFQNALDKNRYDDSEKLVITIPQGTYYISKTMNLYSNTTLNLDNVVLKRSDTMSSGTTMMRLSRASELTGKDEIYQSYDSWHDVTVNGGTFDGEGNCESGMMKLTNISNFHFNGVTFKNYYAAHCLEFAAADGVYVNNCTFENFLGDPLTSLSCEAIQIDVLKKETFKGYGDSDLPCKNVYITGCTFNKTHRGVGSHNGIRGVYHSNINITGNTFNDVYGYAVTCLNYTDSLISENDIINCGSGIRLYAIDTNSTNYYAPIDSSLQVRQEANCTVSSNNIVVSDKNYNVTNYGIYLFGREVSEEEATENIPAGEYHLKKVNVVDNKITMNTTGYGIWLSGADKNTVKNNEIKLNITAFGSTKQGDGIRLKDSDSNIVSGNTIVNLATGCPVSNMSGIIVTEGSKKNTVELNSIENSARDGIFVNESNETTVSDNIVNTSGRDAVSINGSKECVVRGNTAVNSVRRGVTINLSDNAYVLSNKINGTGTDGDGVLVIDSNYVTLGKNTYKNIGRKDYYFKDANNYSIRNDLSVFEKHIVFTLPEKQATCTQTGLTSGKQCVLCDRIVVEQESIAKINHSYKNVITKATLTADGKITPTCTVCGAKKTATAIYMPKTFTLSATKAAYTGKAIKPTVTVKDSKGNVIDAKYYTVTYANNTNVGTATVTVKFKTNYSGTKTLYFTIAPKQVTGLKSSSETTTSLKLTWTKVTGAKYYKVEQSTDGKTWTVIAKANTTNSLAVSKLKAGTKYQFRITALDSTKKIAGKTSAVLKTAMLTAAPTIKLTSTKKATATVTITKVTGATKYTVYKSTDNKKWTKVTDTTKLTYSLTKLSAGKKIYVKVVAVNAYGKNSSYSSVKSVTVKK